MQVMYEVIRKLPKLFAGFVLAALGISLMVDAGIGVSPWATLQAGLESISGISYGRVTQLVGLVIIVSTFFMKVYPGVGTVLNVASIGFLIDRIRGLGMIPDLNSFPAQLVMCFIGLVIFSFGIYLYLSCGLGAGPRDGLMLALIKLTGKPATIIKPVIELTVLVAGVMLGGPFGAGTLMIALLGGRILDMVFDMFKFDPKGHEQQNLVELIVAVKRV